MSALGVPQLGVRTWPYDFFARFETFVALGS